MEKMPEKPGLIQNSQRKKKKFFAKLKASVANTAAKVDVANHTGSSATAANPKLQKTNTISANHSTRPKPDMNFQSKEKRKSAQPIQNPPAMAFQVGITSKVKPKEIPKDKVKVTVNQNANQNRNGQHRPVEKNKKKTVNNKKPQSKPTVSTEPKSHTNPTNRNEGKRKFEQSKTNDAIDTKRLKKDRNGFIETNIDSAVNTKLSFEKPKKVKKKSLHAKKLDECNSGKVKDDGSGPSVKVINVDESQLNGASGHSDSEADSYIDKFFQDDNNEFDENRIYSADEIETKNCNFLAKASGARAQSDDTSPEDFQVHTSDSDDGKIMVSKGNKKAFTNILEEYSSADSDDSGDDSDYDVENGDMFYGTDSDVSLGSVVDSDDLDDTYECESSEESEDGYEMNSSYDEDDDDDSEFDESDRSDYSSSDSQSSDDTYNEFLNSRHYESSNDDQDYHNSRYDDVRIAQGTAITHKITDKRIKIFDNDTESHIIEVPKTDSENEQCVNLVPINASRTEVLRMERRKQRLKQMELEKKKQMDEIARLEHEQAVSAYYEMDKFSEHLKLQMNDRKGHSSNKPKKSISIVKCSKNFKHLSLDWMEVDNVDAPTDNEIDYSAYPKSKAINVISIGDKSKPDKRVKKSKASAKKGQATEMPTTGAHSKILDQPKEIAAATPSSCSEQSKRSTATTKAKESQFFNSINSRHVLLLLRRELHFHGSLHVKLIAGKATAFGYELQHNKTSTLHSPRGHGFINLIPLPSETINQQQYVRALDSLTADFYAQDIGYLKGQLNCRSDAILLLEREQSNKGVNMIDRYMRETMFPNINAFNNDSPFYSSEFVLHCKFLSTPDNGLMLNDDQWSTIQVHNATKLMAIGGKGVGKSTFMRYLINSNIGKFPTFLYIDLDIGQPELFVPQTLSASVVTQPILGPGYLQNIKPSKAVLFGDINILPNPIKYLRCVQEIFTFCSSQTELSTIPWVINTMGYSRGFGNELIACILKMFQPTDVVQIQSHMYADNFEQIMTADTVNAFKFNVFEREMADMSARCHHKMHAFDAMRGKNNRKHTDMTAKDLRYTMILAKLGNCLKYNSDWLTSVKPFEASLNDLEILITSGEEINSSDHLHLLNGNLVYLCRRQPDQITDIIDCLGIGIVRSVDAHTRKLYLLSTIPLNEMHYVNVLAIGAIPLPSAVFLNQHVQVRGIIPYVYNSDDFIGSKQVALHIFRPENKSNNKPVQLMED